MKRQIDRKMIRENPDQMTPGTLLESAPAKWEYKSLLLSRTADLNRMGLEGWELISVIPQPGDQAVFYFRRPKR